MKGIYTLETLISKHKINTKSGRKFLSKLIFPTHPKTTAVIKRIKKADKTVQVWKIRLCRTFANKDQNGTALTRHIAKKKRTWTMKFKPSYTKMQKDWTDNNYKTQIHQQETNKGTQFKIVKGAGYYPHIFWKGEWCPLYINVKMIWGRRGSPDIVENVILKWRHGKKGEEQKRDLRRLINDYGKIVPANEKSAKTKGAQERPAGHSIIDIKSDNFDAVRGNSRTTSKSFN